MMMMMLMVMMMKDARAHSTPVASSVYRTARLCTLLVQVRSIEVESVNRQLDAGYMVLLSNLGYSASGAPAKSLFDPVSV